MDTLPQLMRAPSSDAARQLQIGRLSGMEFLAAFSNWLRDELNVNAVTVGEVTTQGDAVHVLSKACNSPRLELPHSYTVSNTPCREVILQGHPVCINEAANRLYPDDEMFQQGRVEGYQGVPLLLHDRVIGLICAFDDKADTLGDQSLELLQWWAPRVTAELLAVLSRRYTLDAAEWIALSGDELFGRIAKFISNALQVSSAFITQWSDASRDSFLFRSFFHDGATVHDFDDVWISRKQAPCERLDENDVVFIRSGLREAYPDVQFIHDFELEAYLGVVLRDAAGHVLGHIAIMHKHPLAESMAHAPLLKIYANRVSAELERMQHDAERSSMETALITSQKLESVGLMAGAIAHDYNNLLLTILGNASLAIDAMDANHPARDYVERLQSAAAQAGDIVSILLDYAGRKPGQRVSIDVNRLIQNSRELVSLADHPGVEVVSDLTSKMAYVSVDQTQLQQVLINLTLNAAEAIEDRGTVVITTSVDARDLAHEPGVIIGRELGHDEYVSISIADTGAGIEPQVLSKIFDPFYTSKPRGRGLGLAVVQGVIRSHEAGLAIRSEPGVGTTISMHFPLVQAPEDEERTNNVGTKMLEGHGTVLVVDDEESVRVVMVAMLEACGYHAVSCEGGEEALDYLAHEVTPAVAIIDVSMPGMDGWTTLGKIRALPHCQDLPVVMISGFTSDQITEQLSSERNVRFLPKPFSKTDLAGCIADVTPAAV
ncbi:MAG: hybrid sensor histidine kinase/response regulator [Pseudomonadales bacterium]